ncbi:MAG: acetyltransferase [Symbiobacteriaceae bacterium]|jgi:GNAT superfamily N-acetyltransferase|nr:acetyltransferase [Symbiobacteriaceae bacterium]
MIALSLHHALANKLPDLPRWVEARALLLSGRADLFGLQEAPDLSVVLRDPESGFVAVVGAPATTAIQAAVKANGGGGTIVAPAELGGELAAAFSGWTGSRLIFHRLTATQGLPDIPPGAVRFLDPDSLDLLSVPEELRNELKMGAAHSAIAATFAQGQPVSFCYACAITESLWDIAIDTLPEHRRRGYAAICATHMIQHMQTHGKQPVWQSVERNPASWQLARKLGFMPVDEMIIFEPPTQ